MGLLITMNTTIAATPMIVSISPPIPSRHQAIITLTNVTNKNAKKTIPPFVCDGAWWIVSMALPTANNTQKDIKTLEKPCNSNAGMI